MKKIERQKVIKGIINSEQVSTQKMLLNLLKAKGISVTQATLSRDMKALKPVIVPHPQSGHIYSLSNHVTGNGLARRNLPIEMVHSIGFSSNLAVLKCTPSFAPSIALILDSQGMTELLGTIAGDDTVLMILNEGISHVSFKTAISTHFPNLGHLFSIKQGPASLVGDPHET